MTTPLSDEASVPAVPGIAELFRLELRGLRLLKKIKTRNDWIVVGKALAGESDRLQWALGDWLRLHRGEWGERYHDAMEVTGFSYAHCRALDKVSETYPFPKDRTPLSLSWSIFKIAAYAPDERRRDLLGQASMESWTVDRMREEVRKLNDDRTETMTPTQRRVRDARRKDFVKCPDCGRVFPIRGNRVTGE